MLALASFFQQQLDFVLFIYGLALILLAAVCLHMRTSPRRLPWLWLGLFGLTGGIRQWASLVSIVNDGASFRLLRLVLLAASYFFLLEFGRRGLKRILGKGPGPWIYLPLGAAAFSGVFGGGQSGAGATISYTLGIPGGILTALVLLYAARTAKNGGSLERLAALALGAYSVFAGLVVPGASFVPASVLNEANFTSRFGVPVQLLLGLLTLLFTASIWSYGQRTRPQLEYIVRRKVSGPVLAIMFVTVLAAGWISTELFGDNHIQMMKSDLTNQTAAISAAIDEHIQKIIETQANPTNPEYRSQVAELKEHLGDIQKANPQMIGLMIFESAAGPRLLMSSGQAFPLAGGRAQAGEAESQGPASAFSGREPVTGGSYHSGSRSYLVSYTPINDSAGKTIAVVAVEFDSSHFDSMIAVYRLVPISITLFVLLIMIGAYVTRQNLAERAEILENAKKRFSDLTHKAIMERRWEVGFEDDFVPTCWEVKKCDKTNCPVYGKEHARCWLIAGTYCRGQVQGQFAQKLGDCSQCDIYREAMTHGPVSEIGENFNSLMWSLREKEDLLKVTNDELEKHNRELKELHRLAEERADTDGLTGLKNHSYFQQRLMEETDRAQRYGRPLSLIMLDLDKFKEVNDCFGHQKGDHLLQLVGKILSGEVRDVDLAARYGGEEFMIIMPEIKGEEAVKAAERLRGKVEHLYREVDLPEHQTAASFGVADFPACARDSSSLIAAADGALLFAKRSGRNRVVYLDEELKKAINWDEDKKPGSYAA